MRRVRVRVECCFAANCRETVSFRSSTLVEPISRNNSTTSQGNFFNSIPLTWVRRDAQRLILSLANQSIILIYHSDRGWVKPVSLNYSTKMLQTTSKAKPTITDASIRTSLSAWFISCSFSQAASSHETNFCQSRVQASFCKLKAQRLTPFRS